MCMYAPGRKGPREKEDPRETEATGKGRTPDKGRPLGSPQGKGVSQGKGGPRSPPRRETCPQPGTGTCYHPASRQNCTRRRDRHSSWQKGLPGKTISGARKEVQSAHPIHRKRHMLGPRLGCRPQQRLKHRPGKRLGDRLEHRLSHRLGHRLGLSIGNRKGCKLGHMLGLTYQRARPESQGWRVRRGRAGPTKPWCLSEAVRDWTSIKAANGTP